MKGSWVKGKLLRATQRPANVVAKELIAATRATLFVVSFEPTTLTIWMDEPRKCTVEYW